MLVYGGSSRLSFTESEFEKHGAAQTIVDNAKTNTREDSVSIVMPVRNQADHIDFVVRAHLERLATLAAPCELILISNGSTDGTQRICQSLAEEFANVIAISTDESGYGLAIRMGMHQAKGTVLGYTSSARTHPDVLLACIEKALENPNIVIKADRQAKDNWRRVAVSRLYNWQCRALFQIETWDVNGTPKIFPAHFKRLTELHQDGYLVDLEFCWLCKEHGYPVLEIPVGHAVRLGGVSSTSWKTAVDLQKSLYLLWSRQMKLSPAQNDT